MKRATRNPSQVFSKVLAQAQERLLLDASGAENLDHKGLKGNQRAQALSDLLSSHLPGDFAISKGEIIDFRDHRTGEIDLCVIDRSSCAPIQSSGETSLIPAEAVYAVIEVKSTLSRSELSKCFGAAQKVRSLRPFKKRFIAPPTQGAVNKYHYRCPYFVFSFKSNTSLNNWARKEMVRIEEVADEHGLRLDLVDRVFMLDRGIIRPQNRHALVPDDAAGIFLQFYIHLMNFLMRERKRRPDIDWMNYASNSKWSKIY